MWHFALLTSTCFKTSVTQSWVIRNKRQTYMALPEISCFPNYASRLIETSGKTLSFTPLSLTDSSSIVRYLINEGHRLDHVTGVTKNSCTCSNSFLSLYSPFLLLLFHPYSLTSLPRHQWRREWDFFSFSTSFKLFVTQGLLVGNITIVLTGLTESVTVYTRGTFFSKSLLGVAVFLGLGLSFQV